MNLESKPDNSVAKDELLNDILKTRSEIQYLTARIHQVQRSCDKLSSENTYLQDYVGSLMSSGLVDKK